MQAEVKRNMYVILDAGSRYNRESRWHWTSLNDQIKLHINFNINLLFYKIKR